MTVRNDERWKRTKIFKLNIFGDLNFKGGYFDSQQYKLSEPA